MGRVTLQTIADHLGVSRTTASNAWSRPDQLSPALRERILEVAGELGYAGPDPAARGLRRGHADAIGLLLTESLTYAFADPYAMALFRGVAAATDRDDIGLLLVPLPVGREVGAALRGAVVDGVVVYSMPDGHPAIDLLRHRGVPLVMVDGPRVAGLPFVGVDDRAAALELTGRVLDAGHRRLLVLAFRVADDDRTGLADDRRLEAATYRVTRERLGGVLDACREAGVARADVRVHEVGLNARSGARRVAAEALAGPRPPTAVVALSDELAAGAFEAANDVGLSVPTDLSVVGYDDLPVARELGLTTVRQPAEDKGARAAAMLAGREPTQDVLLAHQVIDRTSVGPPPA